MSVKPITVEERERLRRLEAEATPGPWWWEEDQLESHHCPVAFATRVGLPGEEVEALHIDGGDALFLAVLRNSYPAMERALSLAIEALESAHDYATGHDNAETRLESVFGATGAALRQLGALPDGGGGE